MIHNSIFGIVVMLWAWAIWAGFYKKSITGTIAITTLLAVEVALYYWAFAVAHSVVLVGISAILVRMAMKKDKYFKK